MQVETLSKTDQIKQQLSLLEAQRESLLTQLETHEPGTQAFVDIATRLVQIRADLESQSTALKAQQHLDMSEAERQAEAEVAAAAAAAAQAKRHAEALKARDQLLSDWSESAGQLKSAIRVWNEFTRSDSYRLLEQAEQPGVAGANYGSVNWDRMVPYCRRRKDGGWTLFLSQNDDRG